MHRIILHIDVNSAFVSWLGAKLVKEGKPDIRLVPSVVSGDPSDRRSIVTAASIPAKNLGIGMGSLTRLVGPKFALQLHEDAKMLAYERKK